MNVLSLDLSINRTGYAIYLDNKLEEYGYIKPERYKGHSIDRYPKKTILFAKSVVDQIEGLLYREDWDLIIIEEININGRPGIKSVKGLAMIHGLLLGRFSEELLNKIELISPSGWRKKLNIRKNDDWKKSTISFVNKKFQLSLTYEENDEADAIAIGFSALDI